MMRHLFMAYSVIYDKFMMSAWESGSFRDWKRLAASSQTSPASAGASIR